MKVTTKPSSAAKYKAHSSFRWSMISNLSCFQIEKTLLVLLLGLTTVIYIATTAHCVYPGTSATCMAKATGLLPSISITHPLWLAFSKLVALIPISTNVVRLNFFSVVCGILSTYLLFKISSRIIFELLEDRNDIILVVPTDNLNKNMQTGENPENFNKGQFVTAVCGGFVSALSFAFCTPFWIASTSLHLHAFNTLLFLIILHYALKFIFEGNIKLCTATIFLCGIAIVESGQFSILMLIIIFFLFIYGIRSELVSDSFILLFIAAVFMGAIFNLTILFALQISEHTFSADNIIPTLLNLAKSHIHDIQSALPAKGWTLIILQTFLPLWITQKGIKLFLCYQDETSKWKWGIVFLSMTLVCSYFLFNLPGSAWSIAKEGSYLPVFPYLGLSLAAGNVFAYWFSLAFTRRTDENNDIAVPKRSLRILSVAVCCYLLIVAFIAIPRNFSDSNGKSAAFVDNTVKLLMDEITEKDFLITDGLFDMNIHMMKKQNNIKLSVVKIPPRHIRLNMDQKTPTSAPFKLISRNEVKNLKPDIEQFITQWMKKNRHSADRIASLIEPQIWNNAGIIPIPQGMSYTAASSISDTNTSVLLINHTVELNKALAILNSCKPTRPALKRIHAEMICHLSRVTNDLGVYLENAGDMPNALRAYEKALKINSDNVSALLNIYGVVVRPGYDSKFHKFDKLIKTKTSKPDCYTSLTKKIMQSGALKHQQTDKMFSDVINKSGNKSTDPAKMIQFLDKWRKLYYHPAAKTPASLGLDAPLDQKAPNVYLSDTIRAVLEGKTEKAINLLDHYLSNNPKDFSAWALLAEIHFNNNNFEIVNSSIIPTMKRRMTAENAIFVDMTMGCYYKRKPNPDYTLARSSFLKALSSPHKLSTTCAALLDTDKKIGSAIYLKEDSEKILEIAPDNPEANAVLGSYNLSLKNLELAESHLQRSINARPSPEAYNDLAVVYLQQKKFEDAERCARKSICLAPYTYHAWDTLSNICIAQNKIKEAEEAINCAITLCPQKIQPYFTLINILIEKGNKQKALAYLQRIQPLLKHENSTIKDSYKKLYQSLSAH